MKRFYKLLISTLVIIGFVAAEPTETPVEKTDQQVCAIKPGCCVSDQIVDADVKKKKKKKKKKKGLKGGKGKKKKKGFFKKAFGDK